MARKGGGKRVKALTIAATAENIEAPAPWPQHPVYPKESEELIP